MHCIRELHNPLRLIIAGLDMKWKQIGLINVHFAFKIGTVENASGGVA